MKQDCLAMLYAGVCIPHLEIQAHIHYHPEMFKKPFYLLNQETQNQRASILYASPQALAIGIASGQNVQLVQKKFPHIPSFLYQEKYQNKILTDIDKMCLSFTPSYKVQEQQIFLDLTGTQKLFSFKTSLWYKRWQKSMSIFPKIKYYTALTPHKITAILLSQYHAYCNPALFFYETQTPHLKEIPIQFVPNLHPETIYKLNNFNIQCLKDIQTVGLPFLKETCSRDAEKIWYASQGIDLSQKKEHKTKIFIVAKKVFSQDENRQGIINRELFLLTDQLAFMLRKHKKHTKELSLEITYSDGKTYKARKVLAQSSYNYQTLLEYTKHLFQEAHIRRTSIRSLSLHAHRTTLSLEQFDLFQQNDKLIALQEAMDKIRNKHGFSSVGNA